MHKPAFGIITIVWLVLVAATGLSWTLGTEQFPGLMTVRVSSIILFVVAFVKVRFVIQYFMEVRAAPLALRIITEAWAVIACATLIGLFLA